MNRDSVEPWLDAARAALFHADVATAEQLLVAGLKTAPQSTDGRRALAGVYLRTGRDAAGESLLGKLLAEHPADSASAFALAQHLIARCRSSAAADIMLRWSQTRPTDTNLAIRAIELLADCHRQADAASIARTALTLQPQEPRLHAYAGMLALQLGQFETARSHYLFALEHAAPACEWNVPYALALAQRYRDTEHPDLERFQHCLARTDISDRARSALLFALAKFHDDVGTYADAASSAREANRLAKASVDWSIDVWRAATAARLTSSLLPVASVYPTDFNPIFVVGMPRSGTTLVSRLLSRRHGVCNRGESACLATLAQQLLHGGPPAAASLSAAAATYATQLRQDDAVSARWFIDKQPLNFRYLDLALAMFPSAKIIWCRRNARDTALSLWMQAFDEPVQGFAYDFSTIRQVMTDCDRLMAHWSNRFSASIYGIWYEQVVSQPDTELASLTAWLGLPDSDQQRDRNATSSINTASVWQARQPIYARSVGRWRHYLDSIPELREFSPEYPAAS